MGNDLSSDTQICRCCCRKYFCDHPSPCHNSNCPCHVEEREAQQRRDEQRQEELRRQEQQRQEELRRQEVLTQNEEREREEDLIRQREELRIAEEEQQRLVLEELIKMNELVQIEEAKEISLIALAQQISLEEQEDCEISLMMLISEEEAERQIELRIQEQQRQEEREREEVRIAEEEQQRLVLEESIIMHELVRLEEAEEISLIDFVQQISLEEQEDCDMSLMMLISQEEAEILEAIEISIIEEIYKNEMQQSRNENNIRIESDQHNQDNESISTTNERQQMDIQYLITPSIALEPMSVMEMRNVIRINSNQSTRDKLNEIEKELIRNCGLGSENALRLLKDYASNGNVHLTNNVLRVLRNVFINCDENSIEFGLAFDTLFILLDSSRIIDNGNNVMKVLEKLIFKCGDIDSVLKILRFTQKYQNNNNIQLSDEFINQLKCLNDWPDDEITMITKHILSLFEE